TEQVAGTSNHTTITAGEQIVLKSGIADKAIVNGGKQTVQDGGKATTSTVNTGGLLDVLTGGVVTGVKLAGGSLSLTSGATADWTSASGVSHHIDGTIPNINGVTLDENVSMTVATGASATDTTVGDTGSLIMSDGSTLAGQTRVTDGGTLKGTGTGKFTNSGELLYDVASRAVMDGATFSGDGLMRKTGAGSLTLKDVTMELNATALQSGASPVTGLMLDEGDITLDNSHMTLDVTAKQGTRLAFINNSSLTGNIDPTDVVIEQGSTWQMTGNSVISALDLAGDVAFKDDAATQHTLTVTSLHGRDGNITLDANTEHHDLSDKIVLDGGKADGHTGLTFRGQYANGVATTGKGITVVEALNGATTDTGAFSQNNAVKSGALEYTLQRNADESWYLSSDKPQQPAPQQPAPQQPAPQQPAAERRNNLNFRPETSLYGGVYAQMRDMDLTQLASFDNRNKAGHNGQVWVRTQSGALRHSGGNGVVAGDAPDGKQSFTFVQVGMDLLRRQQHNWSTTTGMYVSKGYVSGDVNHTDGANAGMLKDDNYGVGMYLSRTHTNGFYFDGVAQWAAHRIKAYATSGMQMKTQGDGVALSLESGLPLYRSKALTVMPVVQYMYQHSSVRDSHDEAGNVDFGRGESHTIKGGINFSGGGDRLRWWLQPQLLRTSDRGGDYSLYKDGVGGSRYSFSARESGTSAGVNAGVSLTLSKHVDFRLQGSWLDGVSGLAPESYAGEAGVQVKF
ncbi:autotransporter adhesin family protein, partial [Citrobacter portucalensis]|uniref:autotransporter outer membrane beta-barrel domain-containing protein n=1 Tax=Citrobacter portucalensis TaxID=1639133 RepID=UPI00226B4A25